MPASPDSQTVNTFGDQQPNTSSSFGDFGEPTTTSAPQKTIKTTGTKENGNVSKKKVVLATVSTLFVVGAVVVGVSLVQQQQLKVGLAWDCSKYNFEVSREGSVSVINSSSRSEPLQEAMVKINGSLVATFDVPALSQGQSSPLGQVSVPSSGGFSWQVIGSVDCQDTGNYDPLISPTPTTEPTATQTPTVTPTIITTPTITPTITPSLTVTPTTPPGITAQCLSPKAYDTEWNLLSQSDLSSLSPGDTVRFAVSGTTTSGFFDKARFTINGIQRPDVTSKKPGTQEFFDEYVIPEDTTSFKINAQVYHSNLGWF